MELFLVCKLLIQNWNKMFQKALLFVSRLGIFPSMKMTPNTTVGFLKSEFLRRCQRNPRYSQTSFARDLSLSRGELSEILNGKRTLSYKNLFKISQKLGLSVHEREHLLRPLETESENTKNSQKSFELDKHELLANPLILSLFALTDLKDFRWDLEWIARRLECRLVEVKYAIEKLVDAGFLKKTGSIYRVSLDQLASLDDAPSLALRELHKSYLDRASRALDTQSLIERHISGLSMAIKSADLPLLKREISNFMDHIEQKYSARAVGRDALYHMECALFRLDKGEKNEK
jgi:transcriptional regulator with XRE-family HTH domain